MSKPLIVLSDKEPFSHGRYRWCFVHPDEPSRCVKVNDPHFQPELVRKQAPFWKRLRSGESFDHNKREFRFYREYERFYGEVIWRHVPRCYGMVQTDLGPGLVVDFVGDPDGNPGQRLSELLRKGRDSKLDRAITEFREFVLRHRLLTHELRLQNLLFGCISSDATQRIYIIDAIGLSDWIPLAYYSEWLAAVRVKGKIRRFDTRVDNLKQALQ